MGGALNGSWEPYPSSRSSSMSGSSISIPSHNRPNMSISMPLSSLMSPPSSTSSPSRPTMSSLSQSHHSPVGAAAPAELNLNEMTGETVSQLLEKVLMTSGGDKNAVMLLDMRSSVSHAASSIQTAVSVCVPNMLLKRPKTSLQMVTEQLTTEQDIETFSKWKQFANIVLFDASGAVPVVGSPTILMVQKFRKEGCKATLAYLNGGFNEFMVRHNNLCRAEIKPVSTGSSTDAGLVQPRMSLSGSGPFSAPASTNPMSIVSPPRQRLHLGSLPSMMTQPAAGPLGCQTPMIENPNVNPLFESVRQAMGLSTNITEEIPVRLPMGFSFDTMREHLPKWLLSAITDDSGKARLAEYFQKVEINENKRLALLMLPQNMRSGRTTNFSIGAGIEQGLKNRYNNIWPYDHSRVKLTEIDAGHDDYINASFLTPPLSRKSYIATQGPLPSTFQDFWKTAWEQNSRVVVMLTREQEMGRIKCHQYWPSSQHPLMEVGSMRVSFVNEFLPDPTIGTILVRQMKLQHIRRPDEPARSITQIQYTGWPDFGVPETPLEVLRVIQLANEHNVPASAGPMIVHCSAGCGRTGAFCVIDSILTELHEHPEVVLQHGGGGVIAGTGAGSAVDDPMADIVYASVSTFREQRISMVQTLRQYVFCYEAIYWHLALEFAKERPDLGLMVAPPPSLAVHTPLLPMPPNTMTSNPALSMGNAPITTTSEEFSFFG
ncbi:MAG: protein-tyrosine phosphatase-like protein [Linnemannia elongata]|nr:MAG: protein-tyrosine phosphatase-like protein [Linnemannia elongata]